MVCVHWLHRNRSLLTSDFSYPCIACGSHDLRSCVFAAIRRTAVKQQAIFHLGKEPPLDSSALSGCLRRCWSAHTDAIASLQVTSHPKSVVTCGFDKRVCVWSWKGDPLGSLKQRNVVQKFAESQVMDLDGTGQLTGASTVAMDTSWAFKPDLEGRHNGLHNVAKRAAFEVSYPRLPAVLCWF